MIEAYLYNRQSRALTILESAAILDTMPQPPAPPDETDDAPVKPTVVKKRETVKGAFRGTVPRCHEGELLWLDIIAPTLEDYALITQRFALHPMVAEDLKVREGRPKIHDYGDYLYLLFHALSYEERAEGENEDEEPLSHEGREGVRYVLRLNEIDCLVGADYVVTLHHNALQPMEDLQRRWRNNHDLMRSGTSFLLYEIMDEVLDDYFPLLDKLDERIDEMEDRLFEDYNDNISGDIFALKRCLVQVRRIAGPMRDVVNVLLRRDADSGGKHFAYYQDLYDHAVRIVDMIDAFRDILSGALDAYLAMASNRMNEVMKTLTATSIMLLVPALIASVYGMNFKHMPELESRYGYYFALGTMATAVIALFALFRRKGWL